MLSTDTHFPLKITHKGDDCEEIDSIFYITKDDWTYTNFSNPIIGIEGEKMLVEVDAKMYTIVLKGCDSGINIEYLFKPNKGSWVLFQIDDYSN